jgi:hypothetical protein
MTEHRHEWKINSISYAHCTWKKGNILCHAELDPDEIERRLNAVESMLNVPCPCDEAFTARDMHSTTCIHYWLEWAGLEGDDETE